MGVVYKARQVGLNRIVALKMILAGQLASREDVERFHREAEAAANLDHPHVVPIYEVGEHEGQHFFSMNLVEGGSLAHALASGHWPVSGKEAQRQSAQLVAVAARAVHHAHQRGVLHRDLKPGNILLDAQGQPRVTDFGLARRRGGRCPAHADGVNCRHAELYAARAGAIGKGPATGVDVYTWARSSTSCSFGRPPFRAETPLDTVLQVLEHTPSRRARSIHG